MSITHVRLKTAASVQLADGSTAAKVPGDVVAFDELAEHVQAQLSEGDLWLDDLFDTIEAKGRKPKSEKTETVARVPDGPVEDENPVIEQARRRGRTQKDG